MYDRYYLIRVYDAVLHMSAMLTDQSLSILWSLLLPAVAVVIDGWSPDHNRQSRIVSSKIHVGVWFLSAASRTFQIVSLVFF